VTDKKIPESFYRGISNKDFIRDGHVLPSAFQFDKPIRDDGFQELSINWNDGPEALEILLTQKKENGKLQFVGGVAYLELGSVKSALKNFMIKKHFDYERRELPENEFHGNLLVAANLDKNLRALISAVLATTAGYDVFAQENEEEPHDVSNIR